MTQIPPSIEQETPKIFLDIADAFDLLADARPHSCPGIPMSCAIQALAGFLLQKPNPMKSLRLILPSLFVILVQQAALANNATWNANPTSGDWDTATNWTPNTVPGDADIATFNTSTINAKGNRSTVDKVVANGVTINSRGL